MRRRRFSRRSRPRGRRSFSRRPARRRQTGRARRGYQVIGRRM